MLQKIFYIYRVSVKALFFVNFGVGSIVLSSLLFPLLFFKARWFISLLFLLFVWQMRLAGILTMKVKNRDALKNLHSKVVVANHPSLLDVVLLISLIPNADCLVNKFLGRRNIVRFIVNSLYISNDLDFAEITNRVCKTLEKKHCFLIFPEGSRTVPGKSPNFKKGAARLALACGCDIVPVHIGGNEKIGLRKRDPFFSFHPTERYHYVLEVAEPISISEYKNMPISRASKLLNEKIEKALVK